MIGDRIIPTWVSFFILIYTPTMFAFLIIGFACNFADWIRRDKPRDIIIDAVLWPIYVLDAIRTILKGRK
jgi:hypothetical protein